jgi:hypothetical protein
VTGLTSLKKWDGEGVKAWIFRMGLVFKIVSRLKYFASIIMNHEICKQTDGRQRQNLSQLIFVPKVLSHVV